MNSSHYIGSNSNMMGSTDSSESMPEKLRQNIGILNQQEVELINHLLALGQHHLFASWHAPGERDEDKHSLLAQLTKLDGACPGGLTGYIQRARKLLASSRAGENPFDGWTPSVPVGVRLDPCESTYNDYESVGLAELQYCGFVLAAGGLGERLGFNGIKVALPVDIITHRSYLQHYCEQILAIQRRYAGERRIPLAIMVSEDTEDLTISLLTQHGYWGLASEQVSILKQEKVPALSSNLAHIALSTQYVVDAKPHGHGDVHSLLLRTGVAKQWHNDGVRWLTFFQDTNALSFVTLPAMLGASMLLSLDANSMAVPRQAKQSVGAITKLVHKDGREMTINVEYNQLDPLLRATICPEGDTNDASGYSPFPGNINQLVFRMETYLSTLEESQGLMPEFVNPKYANESRTTFKKPTRLECMMQDFPRLFSANRNVGFSMAPAWLCYSPCKNNIVDAAASIAAGVPASAAFTAESDQWLLVPRLLKLWGAHIQIGDNHSVQGVVAPLGPRILVHPDTAIFPCELRTVFKVPNCIDISSTSTLVLSGKVVVESLTLDGFLNVCSDLHHEIVLHVDPQQEGIRNAGHVFRELTAEVASDEVLRIRGYLIEEKERQDVSLGDNISQETTSFVFQGDSLVPKEAWIAEQLRTCQSSGVTSSKSWFPCMGNIDCT